MDPIKTSGIILRTVSYGESDRLLTVYSEDLGLITVGAARSRSVHHRRFVATEQFCYCRFLLTKRGGKYRAQESELIEGFFELRADVVKVALGNYLCEVIAQVGTENQPEGALLRLILNSLYAIAKGKAPEAIVKGCFEMRAAAELGFRPELNICAACGEEGEDVVLDVMNGAILCADCRREAEEGISSAPLDGDEERTARILCPLTAAARAALYYAVHAPLEKLFSFRIQGAELDSFAYAAETYLLNHLEFGLRGLDYYKDLASMLTEKKAEPCNFQNEP